MFVPGRNPTIEALRAKTQIKHILLQEEIAVDPKIAEIIELGKQQGVDMRYVPRKQLDRLAGNEPHQGVIAEVDFIIQKLTSEVLRQKPGLYIYIREAQYEHNVGAIIRTAEAAGVKGFILPPKQEVTDVVARISTGAIFHVPVFQASLFPALRLFKDEAYTSYALEINGKTGLYETAFNDNALIVVGGEDKSISSEVADHCDELLNIPQFGKVNSLNMSVAAALVIYEYVRQKTEN